MLNSVLKLVIALPLLFIMILIVMVNVKLSYTPRIIAREGVIHNHDLIKELRGLKRALDKNADIEMQHIYPEGYVFLNTIYSLAWCSFLQDSGNREFAVEGRAEIKKSWLKINSSTGQASFSEALPLPYGAFYNGWSSYLLGSKLQLETAEARNGDEVDLFKERCSKISIAIKERTYPVSYYGGAWPADVMVCIAALSLHDKLFEPEYKSVIDQWLVEVKKNVDVNGMIPHSVHPANGSVRENARGSSLALMLVFLRDIDDQFAKEQFNLFKEKFIDTRFGLTGIREYPKGTFGVGDVDSGPLIFGFGGAATIVGMQTLSLYGEQALSFNIRNTVDAFAFAYEGDEEKKYFFGLLPMADAFIAWSHSNINTSEKDVSFRRFHLYSVAVFTLISIFFWILVAGEKPDSKRSLNVSW